MERCLFVIFRSLYPRQNNYSECLSCDENTDKSVMFNSEHRSFDENTDIILLPSQERRIWVYLDQN
jgi:hypothetical protein